MGNRLLTLFEEDKEAMKKFINVKSKSEALAIAQKYLSDYTDAELHKDIQDFQTSQAGESSLSDKDLEKIVGGAAHVINMDYVIEGLINFDT